VQQNLTLLAADFAPVTALAVGSVGNVGRKRQAPRQARRG
jgi:predicted outer membrane lipoprotein